MSLHIILGSSSRRGDTAVELIYAGPSGVDARAAAEASTCEYLRYLHNPEGYVRHNPRAAANRAALDPAAQRAAAEAAELARLEREAEAERIREEVRARARARVAAGEIAAQATEVVKAAIGEVAAQAAAAGEDGQDEAAEDPAAASDESSHFMRAPRRRRGA